jgi:hypothetical protein
MPQKVIRIQADQPMTPVLFAVCDVYAFPVIDQKWDNVKKFLASEEQLYRLAGLLDSYKREFGAPASATAALELSKAVLGKTGGEDLDEFERKALAGC